MSNKENDEFLEASHEAVEKVLDEDYSKELEEKEAERYEDRAEESNYQGYDR